MLFKEAEFIFWCRFVTRIRTSGPNPGKKVAYMHVKRLSDRPKARCADPIGTGFVFLYLLEPHANGFPQIRLADPHSYATGPNPLAHDKINSLHLVTY